MAEQRIESQLSSLRKLITPISSQETFASELCGLPCAKHGCRRFHLGTKIPDTKNRRDQYVVGPTLDTLESDHFFGGIGSWLLVTRRTNTPNLHVVWTKAADFQGLSEREEQIIPRVLEGWLVSEDESIALFGMGCPVQLERSLSDAEVQYCEFWIKLDGEWREVTRWDGNNEHNRETLAEAFGCKTFDPLMITETEKDESINLGTSIAELINQYMDARCAFRVNASYRYHGMVQCRAERTLYSVFKQDWLEFPPIVSVLDPDSEEVLNIIQDSSLVSQNKLEFARLGKDKHPATEAANCFKTIGALNQEILRYPDLFASVGRRHLLPEESGRSYVAVPRGEVVCVLLNWLVLRILVLEELRGEDQFRRCLDNWREEMIELGKGRDFLRESDFHFKHAARVFEKLLDVEVELPPRITLDDDNELSLGYKIELQEESIAAEALLRETPVRFGSILAEAALGVDMKTIFSENTANLKNSSQNVSIQAAATFLCEFFSEDNSKLSRTSDFRQVPMYHHIRWKSHPTLHQAIEVFAALVNAESQTIEKDQSVNGKESEMLIHMRFRVFMLVFFSIVHDIAAKDNKNCLEKLIFDLKHITSNSVFPFSLAIPSLKTPYAVYLILPLHEERIGRILRPVVFGHVFAGRSGWDTAARAAWATPTKIKNLAEDWTSILAPIGAEVGHALFDRLLAAHLERQYRLRSGYFIAHELNGIVNKQGTPIINRALRSGNQQLRPLRGFFNRLSSFASLACMLGDVSLALDDDHEQKKMKMKRQIQRVFIPLIELRMRYERDDVLPMLTSAVVSTVFAQATEGLKDYTVELSISPKQSGNPSAVVGSMEWESIALILGELVWNFVAHAADTGDGTGAFTSEIKGHELICRLTQFGFRQPYPEESVTFEYLGDILRMSGCGEAKYWVEDGQLIWEIVIDMSESKKRIEE